MSEPLVLASRSPQRRAILEQLGVDFTVRPPEVEESTRGEPRAIVIENALAKARSVAALSSPMDDGAGGPRVLGVDTAVVLDGRVFGKPRDREEAETFLRRLSGRTHEVWSGIALVGPDGAERTESSLTRVRFRRLEEPELDWYLDSEEWRERAGGYAIQGRGAALVEAIEGDFWNVVGLPIPELLKLAPEIAQAPRREGVS
jgi:septum formation protein